MRNDDCNQLFLLNIDTAIEFLFTLKNLAILYEINALRAIFLCATRSWEIYAHFRIFGLRHLDLAFDRSISIVSRPEFHYIENVKIIGGIGTLPMFSVDFTVIAHNCSHQGLS